MNATPAAAQPQPAPESKPLLLRFFFALAWGSLVIVVGAVIWGLVAYFTNSVYVIIAFFLGLAVSAAILLPLKPIHKAVALIFLPVALAGTLLSILLGESLYTVLFLIRDYQASVPDALITVVEQFNDILAAKDTLGSLALGGIGGLIGYFATWKDL
jgi:hypothetical protein